MLRCKRYVQELRNGMFIEVLNSQPLKNARAVQFLDDHIGQEAESGEINCKNLTVFLRYNI